MMVTNSAIGAANEKTRIDKFIDKVANRVHAQDVHKRMFNGILVTCRKFLGRAGKPSTEQEFYSKLAMKRLRPRRVTGITVAVLSFVILAHRTGMPVPSLDWPVHFTLIGTWNAAKHDVIRLTDRVREDYQSVQLIYQITRQIRTLQEQQGIGEQRAKLRADRCRMAWHEKDVRAHASYPTAKAMALNGLRCSFSFD